MKEHSSGQVNADTDYELRSFNQQILEGLVQKSRNIADHVDSQTNIIIGVSAAVFVFSLSRILDETIELPFLVISIFSGASTIIGLLAIHPPNSMRKCGQKESIMYNRSISSFKSPSDYAKALAQTMASEKRILEEYATEIYNLSKYYYRPKRRLFHLARNVFITGIVLTFFVYIVELGS